MSALVASGVQTNKVTYIFITHVHSDHSGIVFTGDIVHVAAVQLPQPNVTVVFDVDSKKCFKKSCRLFQKMGR